MQEANWKTNGKITGLIIQWPVIPEPQEPHTCTHTCTCAHRVSFVKAGIFCLLSFPEMNFLFWKLSFASDLFVTLSFPWKLSKFKPCSFNSMQYCILGRCRIQLRCQQFLQLCSFSLAIPSWGDIALFHVLTLLLCSSQRWLFPQFCWTQLFLIGNYRNLTLKKCLISIRTTKWELPVKSSYLTTLNQEIVCCWVLRRKNLQQNGQTYLLAKPMEELPLRFC